MKRAALGLLALLVAVTAIVATQYGRVQVTAGARLSAQEKDIQFLARDLAPEDPTTMAASSCTGAAPSNVLCSDGAGNFFLALGTWAEDDVKVFTAAFAIVNAELGDVTITNMVCVGGANDLCPMVTVNLHEDGGEYCYTPPVGPWPPTGGVADAACQEYLPGPPVAPWVLNAACPTCAVPTGYTAGPDLDYGENVAGSVYDATYDAVDDLVWEWDSVVGGGQPATSGTDNHVWVEIAMDFTGVPTVGTVEYTGTIYILFSSP